MSENPVVHFEMPYEKAERVTKFYELAFGWGMQLVPGAEMGDYILARTAETDENWAVRTPGAINGGFFPVKPDVPAQHPSVVIEVADIRLAAQKVADAGGQVLGEPVEIPGTGTYVSILDTEGNRVGLLQPEGA